MSGGSKELFQGKHKTYPKVDVARTDQERQGQHRAGTGTLPCSVSREREKWEGDSVLHLTLPPGAVMPNVHFCCQHFMSLIYLI